MDVLMLAGAGESSYIVFHALQQKYPDLALILEEDEPKELVLKRKIKKSGLRHTLGQILFKTLILPVLKRRSQKRRQYIMTEYSLDGTPVYADGITVFKVKSVNSQETIDLIHQMSPKVIIVNGTRIIKKQVLESTSAAFINMHAGITPKYRGVYGAYWALTEKDAEHCGVTVHLVDEGIDTGNILYQSIIEPKPADNFATYPLLQTAEGVKLEMQAISDALNHCLVTQRNGLPSKLWTHPTIGEYFRNYRKGVK